MRLRRLACIAVAGLLVTSCSNQTAGLRLRSSSGVRRFSDCKAGALSGSAFLVAGDSNVEGKLYRLDFCPLKVTEVGNSRPVTGVGANGDLTVVSESTKPNRTRPGEITSQDYGGFPDRLRLLGNSSPKAPLPDLQGNSPAVSSKGLVAFVVGRDDPAEGSVWELKTWDSTSGVTKSLLTDKLKLAHPTWAPNGSLVVLETPTPRQGQPTLLVFDADGTGREVPLWIGEYPGEVGFPGVLLSAGAGDWVALSSPVQLSLSLGTRDGARSLIVNTRTREEVHETYQALAWSPNGDQLLVRVSWSGLGVVRAPNWNKVSPVGPFESAIYDLAWAK